MLIDFGTAIKVNVTTNYDEKCGTIHYMPPEIRRTRTGKELLMGDCWALGVLAYVLVCGKHPFRGKSKKEILMNIERGPLIWLILTPSQRHVSDFRMSPRICPLLFSSCDSLRHRKMSVSKD